MSSNVEIVRDCIRLVWNEGRVDRIDDFYTEGFTAHYPPVGPPWGEGREGVRNVVQIARRAFPDYRENIEAIHGVDDRVFVRMRNTGTQTGPAPFAPTPTNRSFEVTDILHARLEDGRLAEQWGLIDSLGMFLQLGVLKPPAPA